MKGKKMSYDINVLVNGTRCKQYVSNGRVFIEAKEGSEYSIEIKNNSWEKILAVVSVDGLNVIDGNSASVDGPGYVMDKYTSQKLYGFQYSQDKVASFKFGIMGEKDDEGNPLGYAASKKDGSEKNTGIIGVRIWDEIPKPPAPTPSYAISSSFSIPTNSSNLGGLYGNGRFGYTPPSMAEDPLLECCSTTNYSTDKISSETFDAYIPNVASFDMETQWGTSRTYKVKETTFERRNIIHNFDIYYASREGLIAMGVDLSTEKRVSFPESFKEIKYAAPPKGWKP